MYFQMCHNCVQGGLVQWCWPDGKSGLEQKNYVVELFKVMFHEAQKQINKQMEQSSKHGR